MNPNRNNLTIMVLRNAVRRHPSLERIRESRI